MRSQLATIALLTLVAWATTPAGPAAAAVPYADIESGGPLTHLFVGNDLSCQVAYRGDRAFELYPPRRNNGDCGTFAVVGRTLFAPDFENHEDTAARRRLGTYTPFSALEQSPVTGSGTEENPLRVVTTVALPGTALRIRQTDTYVRGDLTYRTDVELLNDGPALRNVILYRAGDCYLQESDEGYGFVRFGKSIGCSRNPDNLPPARVEQWVPIHRQGAHYYEAEFDEVWARIGSRRAFPDLCRCTRAVDNGAGVSWTIANVPAGATVERSHYTTFSARGVSGTPRSDDRTPPEVYVSSGGMPLERASCSPARFNARVTVLDANDLRQVVITLDGRVLRRTRDVISRVTVSVAPRAGATHRIGVRATDARGNRSRSTVRFRVCESPRFTG